MSTSPETLRFAKESVKKARLKGETLIADMVPNLQKLSTPIDQRVLELRGFVRGLISGQDDVLNNIRDLVPKDKMPTYAAQAQKVTAPEAHWSEKFDASLAPLIEGEQKSQERAKIFLANLAKRVRDLVVWEGILEQALNDAESAVSDFPLDLKDLGSDNDLLGSDSNSNIELQGPSGNGGPGSTSKMAEIPAKPPAAPAPKVTRTPPVVQPTIQPKR